MKLTDITVTRLIPASPDEVFEVWNDPKSPGGPWYGAARLIINPSVDSLFYFAVHHEGRDWAHYGRFTALDRPSRVQYTWMSEATRGLESLLTVTFQPSGGQTEVTLRHTGVPDDEMGRQHGEGWTWVLSMLAERFAKSAAIPSK